MRMNMSDFATFFAVARNQSFRAAGDELGLSSSAIGHSINTLGRRLIFRFFTRAPR
ncbi:LysR family transcriptional regulator, partial [Escherichia coli]|nr:LysR family transcriptional regulator [Escherichia coli]